VCELEVWRVAQEAAASSSPCPKLSGTGPGLDSHRACYTRQPERHAHPNKHPGTIATLTSAIIGASSCLALGNNTRPPSSLASAHYCHRLHHQPHPSHAASSIHRNTRRVFPAHHASGSRRPWNTTTHVPSEPPLRAVEPGSAQHLIDDGTCRSSAQRSQARQGLRAQEQ
jgi:hypothetical protein